MSFTTAMLTPNTSRLVPEYGSWTRRCVPVHTNPSRPSMVRATANVSSTDMVVRLMGRSRDTRNRCIPYPTTKNSGTVMTSDSRGSSPERSWKNQAR
jgi:hypothetical protein